MIFCIFTDFYHSNRTGQSWWWWAWTSPAPSPPVTPQSTFCSPGNYFDFRLYNCSVIHHYREFLHPETLSRLYIYDMFAVVFVTITPTHNIWRPEHVWAITLAFVALLSGFCESETDATQGYSWIIHVARIHCQLPDWLDDHLMEPLSNEEARLRPPASDTQALNDLPPPDDDNDNNNDNDDSFPFPSTPPPTYGEAGKKKKTPTGHNFNMAAHHCLSFRKCRSIIKIFLWPTW